MARRAARVTLLLLLVAALAGAAALIAREERAAAAARAAATNVDVVSWRVLHAVSEARTGLQAYGVPGQEVASWRKKVGADPCRMHAHPGPKKVIVIGGGDGGVVREVLKHKTIEKMYFVEIDEEVINIARRFFPNVSSGVDDPRVEIKIMDGADFVSKRKNADIDAVIIDSTDIIGFARILFTPEFFTAVRDCLTEQGMFVTHTESLHFHKDMVIEIQEALKKVFPLVDLYTTAIATYPGNWWAFAVASKGASPREVRNKARTKAKYYSSEVHQQSFMPKGLYE